MLRYLALFFVLLQLECISTIAKNTREIDRGQFYSVSAIPEEFFLSHNKLSGIVFSAQKTKTPESQELAAMLSRIHYEKFSISGKRISRVFNSESIEEVSAKLSFYLKNNPVIFVNMVYNDTLSHFTRLNRITFYLFQDQNGTNFVFGDIQQNINFEKHYSYIDWQTTPFRILPVANTSIMEPQGGKLKKLSEKKFNWIIFDKLSDNPEKREVDNIEKRLRELKQLFEKNLIDKKTYELKMQEILKDL